MRQGVPRQDEHHEAPDDRDRLFKVLRAVGALALDAHLSLFDEGIHGRGRLLEVFPEITMVEIIDVDAVPLEIDERLFALMPDVGRFIGMPGRSREVADLGRNDKIPVAEAKAAEDPREHPFGPAVAIDIGIVEMGHPGINGLAHSGDNIVLLDIGPAVGVAIDPVEAAHGPAAKADFTHFDVGIAELAVGHRLHAFHSTHGGKGRQPSPGCGAVAGP